MKAIFLAASVLCAAASSSQLLAHDFWIEPSTFRPEAGSLLSARTFVGERFTGDPLPRREEHIVRFFLAGPSGQARMLGSPGRDPAGVARVESTGPHVIGYESRPSVVGLSPAKLQRYVEEEGLQPFFRGDVSKPIRDRFSRYAKSLVLASIAGPHGAAEDRPAPSLPAGPDTGSPPGDGPAAEGASLLDRIYERPLGFALELVPEANPYALEKDASFPVRLLRDGQPLEGALVVAMEQGRQEHTLQARTDRHGRVRFTLPPGPGRWLVKSAWIRPVPGKRDEWESSWASLTFETSGGPGGPGGPLAAGGSRGPEDTRGPSRTDARIGLDSRRSAQSDRADEGVVGSD